MFSRSSDHIRHHAHTDHEHDPYNSQRGFWYSHCGWLFFTDVHADEKYASRLRQDPVVMWQHRYYMPIVLSGLGLTFVVGFLYNGWMGGLGCFLLAGVDRTFAVPTRHFASIQSATSGEASLMVKLIPAETADPSKWLIFTLSKDRTSLLNPHCTLHPGVDIYDLVT